jgi:predicted secreted protein
MAEPEELQAEGVAGLPITLPISTGPATGYDWEFELPEGVERLPDRPERDATTAGQPGGALGGRIQVTAVAGDHVLTGRLVRPWRRDAPIRTVQIRLSVKK